MTRLPADILSDPALIAVLDAIEAEGHSAFLVGGAVRNALLEQPVEDIDIATDAQPDQVMRLAEDAGLKTVPTGIEHGTVTIVADRRGFEVTTFRRDVETDGRRAVVAFSEDLTEDARRRDFTMNALYADKNGCVIDPVGGLPDLEARRLRFVGSPRERIEEDYLRILRFFRFLAWYGKEAEPGAVAACTALKDGLSRIARERIGAEVRKMLAAPDPTAAVTLMAETGVLDQILPHADPGALASLVSCETREDVPPSWSRRLAALSGGKDRSADLRLSKKEARVQLSLVNAKQAAWSLEEAGYRLGKPLATDYALLRDAHTQELPKKWREQLNHAASAQFPISARDLMPYLKGPALGRGLEAAEKHWISSGFTLEPPELLAIARDAGGPS